MIPRRRRRRALHRECQRALRRALRREDGSSTLEFVIMLPLFLMIFMAATEAGVMLTRQAMLERALDVAIRDLRLGTWVDPTADQLKDRICENSALIRNCGSSLLLELQPVNTADWVLPADPASCVDRQEDIQPVTTFVPGAGNQLMLVRACTVIDPIFPTTAYGLRLPLDESGGYQLRSASTFVNEPR